MSKEKTISDYIAKDRKDIPFEERAKKFEAAIEPLVKEWGIMPWAAIQVTMHGIIPTPNLRDLWDSGNESK